MLLNPFASTVRRRSALPMLPGAFPVIKHMPTIEFVSA
jgi:hypothetical protein